MHVDGYAGHTFDTAYMRGESLRNAIALVVVAVWAVIALSTLVTYNYTALGAVTPVMLIVVGFLFGFRKEDTRIKNGDAPPRSREDLSDW